MVQGFGNFWNVTSNVYKCTHDTGIIPSVEPLKKMHTNGPSSLDVNVKHIPTHSHL